MSNRRRSSFLPALVALVVALLAVPAAAWAEDPVAFGQSPVVDQAGVLGGDLAEVEAALNEAAARSDRQLFVAYVDVFTNPESAVEWSADTAIANNMGAEDYLLAVAVDGHAYYLSADQNASLSDAELDRISSEIIEPRLRDGDWAGAAIAAADAISPEPSAGGGLGWLWILLLILVVAGVVIFFVVRGRRRAATATGPGGAPLPSIDDLRRDAGGALVQLDDAVKTSEEELGFAVASYGEEATAVFRQTLQTAKAKAREAFGLQQRLDDAEPDTDEQRREWYGQILAITGEADALLDAQAASFDALRELERTAPESLARVQAAATGAEAAAGPAAARFTALQAQYAPSALAAVADNPTQARSRLEFARASMTEAQAAITRGENNEAAVDIRAAEEAVDQAKLLAAAVERLSADLAAADQAVAAGITDLEQDVQTARTLQADGLAALAEQTASEAQALRTALAATGRDPLALQQRLEQANAAIDQAVAGARDAAERTARAAAQLTRSIQSARAKIRASEDYLTARRGAIGPEARTRLAEAGRLVAVAETTAATDPVTALGHAQHAERLADDAMRLARTNVGDFGDQYGEGGFGDWAGPSRPTNGGGDLFGAILGGIVLGSSGGRSSGSSWGGSWGGSSRSSGSSWGGSSRSSGSSWGGSSRSSSWGGSSGGRRSAGSFGGSGTRSRRGSGGRF